MSQNYVPLVFLAGIILVAFILAPPLIREGIGGLRDLLKEFRDAWLRDWGNKTTYNQVGLGFTIEYEDGTIDEYTPEDTTFPFTVYYEGKAISVVRANIWYKLTYDQRPQSVSGSYTWNRFFDNEEVFVEFTRDIIGGVPESGVWTVCEQHAGVVASRIEELDAGELTTHTIRWDGTVSLDVDWGTGLTQEHLDGSATGSLTVQVKRSATLDVEVRPRGLNIINRPLT